MPAIDIDRDAAREAAESELAKPIYPGPSWTERLAGWLDELLYRVAMAGSSVPGGWFTLSVLLLLLVLGIVIAWRVARRTLRTGRTDASLFDSHQRSAAEHRATAEQYAAAGNWAAAIRHRLRAVARHLEETGVLGPAPGRTATELARDTGRAVPPLIDELARAATIFNDVTYGERPGSEAGYRTIADLDDHLRFHPPAAVPAAATPGGDSGWAELR